jgi:hypothetical protein
MILQVPVPCILKKAAIQLAATTINKSRVGKTRWFSEEKGP